MSYPRIGSFKTVQELREYIATLGLTLELDDEILPAPDSPLAQPFVYRGRTIGNRFCILPMEGWDGERDGRPSDLTRRRWKHFGLSGGKLIWGGEAVAVRHDGRANPNQLMIAEATLTDLEALRQMMVRTHVETFGASADLYAGLQLTHSGRFAKPNSHFKMEPTILYRHPILDRRFGVGPDHPVLSDSQIADLVGDFVAAAVRAQRIGFEFIDFKHCHGYLGHEFLSAHTRPGPYGGSFENRTRFLREVVAGIRRDAPGLDIAVRFSAFDFLPFKKGPDGVGMPEPFTGEYPYAFGCNPKNPLEPDLAEPKRLLHLLRSLDIRLICVSASSPYYSPHLMRPAAFPPSDGYQPPEDPLIGVARHLTVTRELKQAFPDLVFVGSCYTYLQDFLPHAAQVEVRNGRTDFVGLGRMVLAYPELPADVLAGRPLDRKRLCRTFSDCTTGPRNGLVSGCYPLDPFYRALPEYNKLQEAKGKKRPDGPQA
jgi:2,4-dienoyl-CoA reductase-like NADH-dependent reductase (Old Yellow Enzyme family)